MQTLKIISVGGTIDKIYFDELSEYKIGGPSIREIFEALPVNFSYEIQSLIRKDSLDLTDEDRQHIRTAVLEDKHAHILITHGTDTMAETANVLKDVEGKTIVLTGALEPAKFQSSDAVFNVGCAVGAIQVLTPGVYIAMNGEIFPAANVRKNRARGRFERITG